MVHTPWFVRSWSAVVVAGSCLLGCSSTSGSPDGATPIHFGVMLHLEGAVQFPSRQVFDTYDRSVRTVIDLFDAHQAKITIESEKSYARAASQWAAADNALTYALAKDLGVGSHCDEISDGTAQADFEANRAAVDALVGAEHNLGCSGGWVTTDWAVAAANGGFKYLDGVVFFAYLAVPLANRPVNPATGSPYSDEEIRSTFYHDPAPPDLMDRTYPRLLRDTNDLEADPDGRLLLMTGEIGEIKSLAEGRSSCFPRCALTQEDLDVILDTIDRVFAAKDHRRFSMLYFHFPLDTLVTEPNGGSTAEEKTALVTGWLERMSTLAAERKISWVTQAGAYEQFMGWGD